MKTVTINNKRGRVARRISAHVATAAVVATSAFMGLGAVQQAQAQSGQMLDSGHTDIFNVTASSPQDLKLDLKEDVTGSHVTHAPEDVTLKVKGEAYESRTEGIPEVGVPTYFLPQAQNHNLLWPGWDTQGAQPHHKNIDITFVDVCGPGRVFMWGQEGFGGYKDLLSNGNLVESGNKINQPYNAHVHANWGFERPGTYQMKVQATSNGVASNTATYTWQVEGSSDDGNADKPADGANPCGGTQPDSGAADPATPSEDRGGVLGMLDAINDSVRTSTQALNESADDFAYLGRKHGANSGAHSAPNSGNGASPQAAQPTQSPQQPATTTNGAGTSDAQPAPTGEGHTAAGSADAAAQCTKGEPALRPLIKDDRQQPAQWVAPNSLEFALGSGAKQNLPQDLGPVPKGEAWMIGSTQTPGVPWLGANTMHEDLLNNIDGDVTFALTGFDGPGNMYVFEQGGLGEVVGTEWFAGENGQAKGSHVIPRNSHVHPNWVFSKPGTYKVTVTQSATLKNGKEVSAPATLTFNVGDNASGNATEGHFDFGADITEDGDCNSAAGGASGAAGGGDATGSGAAGSGNGSGSSGASGSLANTGVSEVMGVSVAGSGALALGAGLLFWLRSMNRIQGL